MRNNFLDTAEKMGNFTARASQINPLTHSFSLTSSKSGPKPFNRKLKTILKEAQTKRKEEAYDGIEYVGFNKRGKVMYPDKKNWDEKKDKPEEKLTANFDKEIDGPETKTWMSMPVVEPASLASKLEHPNP